MKILMINVVCGIGSTGKICSDLAEELTRQGNVVKIAYGRGKVPDQYSRFAVRIGNDFDVYKHALMSRVFDSVGLESKSSTVKFIEWVKIFDPDVIHLHNLHGYYINLPILFQYLRECGKRILWTLHDCWPLTGHCAHFDYVKCFKWKTGCHNCEQLHSYPASYIMDCSKRNYAVKKSLFVGIPNLVLVVPSQWLSDIVGQSFFKGYIVKVIPNGIDTNIFKPISSNLREKLKIGDKKVILGVANRWSEKKGLKDLLELHRKLDNRYKMILIGVNARERKKAKIDTDIITIRQMDNKNELANYYTIADVFVIPTYEDTYPTVNLEAIACGTPVISYETGGSGESASCFGTVVPQGDIEGVKRAIMEGKYTRKAIELSRGYMVSRYMRLYTEPN